MQAAGVFWVKVADPVDVRIEITVDKSMRGQGHAVLSRVKSTGEWVCRIRVKKQTPRVMRHELKHCEGYVHGL